MKPAGIACVAIWFCLLGLPSGLGEAHGQVTITARFDRQSAAVGEQFNLIVQVDVADGELEREPIVPQPDGLQIRTPYTQQSQQFIMRNNRMSQKASWTFTYPIYALKEGTYRFEGIHVVQKGVRFTAAPAEIVVSQGGGPQVAPGTQGMTPQGTAPQAPPPQGLELVAKLDPPEAYQGQQVILTFILTTEQPLERRPQFEGVNTFQGFFTYDVTPPRISQSPVQIQGKTYYQLEVGRFGLFPVPAGEITVPPVNLVVHVPDTRRRGFGFFEGFFQESRQVRVASKAVTLKVKPLPEELKPADFQGAVGKLNLSAKVSRSELEAGEALSLTVEARGEANFRALGSIILPPFEGFAVYDSKQSDQMSGERGRISGVKVWEYVLVPEEPGQLEIGPVELPIFNPEKGTYETLTTDPFRIAVRASTSQKQDRIVLRGAGGRQREVVLEGEDFRYIITDAEKIEDEGDLLIRKPYFLALNAVPVMVAGGAWLAERRRRRLARDPVYARRLRAPAHARGILAEAERVQGENGREFDALLSKAIVEFLDLRFGIPARGMLSEDLNRELVARGVSEELRAEVTGLLAELDESRFARAEHSAADLDGRLRRARDLIRALENPSNS